MPQRKVIITCAVTGSIHTPSMSPHLPITVQQIADEAVAAVQAGAAIVHLHARDPKDGRPVQTPEAFLPFVTDIKRRCDGVINITTGGAPTMTVQERMRPALELKPEVASLNMGSMNFGLYPMLKRFKEFQHDWERAYLEKTKDLVFKNTFADIEYVLSEGTANGTRFEFECYDTAHLYNLAHFVERGLVKTPFLVQTVFGILGGIGAHPDDVAHMKRTADRLFGNAYLWSVLGAGRAQMPMAAWRPRRAATCAWGLRTRCGTGRGNWRAATPIRCGACAASSRGWACRSRRRDEARAMLGLKGKNEVGF